MSEAVTLSTRGDVAIITLDKPKSLNSMTIQDYHTLADLLRNIATREEITYTVIVGTGRFFSSGADVKAARSVEASANESIRRAYLTRLSTLNIDLARAFFTHPKILVAALNGPAVGLSAAMLGMCDFIYSVESAWIVVPFSSLGLVAEGAASYSFVQRMGIARANEALIHGKKLGSHELANCGFVNKIFPNQPADAFLNSILALLSERSASLNKYAMLKTKDLIQRRRREDLEKATQEEVTEGLETFLAGTPQAEFKKIAEGTKRHKL